MTTFRSEETLVGIIVLALIPWIGWTIFRGIKRESLPLGRSYVRRDRPAAFGIMLTFYLLAAVVAAWISLDLLFHINLRTLL
jgi:di/tricarboxylate transporter